MCVNHELDAGCGEVQRELFRWGLGDKLGRRLRSMAEESVVLCASNMRALIKDHSVSLPVVLFKNRHTS